MNQPTTLQVFENHGFQVEVLVLDGKELFNAKNVARCLDLSNVSKSFKNFEGDEKVLVTNDMIITLGLPYGKEVENNSTTRKLHNNGETFLTEGGVYRAVFGSSKPEAREFKRWIFQEILPAIRKTGFFSIEEGFKKMMDCVPEPSQGVIYIISEKGTTKAKIGCTEVANIKGRLSTLQVGNPNELCLDFISDIIDYPRVKEQIVHTILQKSEQHIRGEWYNIEDTDKVIDLVKNVCANDTYKL